MTREEQEAYNIAVEFVELHGGIVLNPHETDQSILAKIEMYIEDTSEPDDDFKERLETARSRFNEMIGSKQFSFTKIEDMMYEEGLEMDYLEDFIHEQY